jgi:hypothetical protein
MTGGGYRLILGPENDRLIYRLLHDVATDEAIAFVTSWIKPIDTVNPALASLREYVARPLSPFRFGVAELPPGYSPAQFGPALAQAIRPIDSLLKFQLTIVDESEVRAGSVASMVLAGLPNRDVPDRSRTGRRHAVRTPQQVWTSRVHALRRHFPVTLERASRSQVLQSARVSLESEGIRRWQADQAVCNAVLSRALTGRPHYYGLSQRRVDKLVGESLDSRFETADGTPLPSIPVDELREQVLADSRELLTSRGRHPRIVHLQDAIQLLAQAGLLEASDVA